MFECRLTGRSPSTRVRDKQMRKSLVLFQFGSGANPFGGGAVNPFANFGGSTGGGAVNPFADLMKPNSDGNRFDGNFQPNNFLDNDALSGLRSQLQKNLTPEVQQNIQRMMSSMQQGKEHFPTMGVMAFGVGENERGKKVARGAKMEFDPATGKMKTEFAEHQLDPDDIPLPKETVENYDTENCVEVEFAEDTKKVKGESILEHEIEVESIDSTKK